MNRALTVPACVGGTANVWEHDLGDTSDRAGICKTTGKEVVPGLYLVLAGAVRALAVGIASLVPRLGRRR